MAADIYYVPHVSAFLHLFLVVGPNTRQRISLSASWALYLPLSLPFGSHKATYSVYISFRRLGFSHRCPLFSITSPSFLYVILASMTAASPIIGHSRLFFSPISVFDIRNRRNIHTSVEQLLHFLFGLSWISRTVPTPLSTLVHIPSKQFRQCRAWTRPEFWGIGMKESV